MPPKRKQTRTGAQMGAGRGERQPKTAAGKVGPESGEHLPTFSFRHADRAYAGAWSWPTDAEAAQLLNFICEMEKLTWVEIKSQMTSTRRATHRKHHYQDVTGLCAAARERITELKLDEIMPDEVFRFRLGNTVRLWGFLVEGVFYVLWWDADHKVYPTERD